jgi:hypothetical protein
LAGPPSDRAKVDEYGREAFRVGQFSEDACTGRVNLLGHMNLALHAISVPHAQPKPWQGFDRDNIVRNVSRYAGMMPAFLRRRKHWACADARARYDLRMRLALSRSTCLPRDASGSERRKPSNSTIFRMFWDAEAHQHHAAPHTVGGRGKRHKH